MDYGQACRQTFIYRITEGLLVIRPVASFAVRELSGEKLLHGVANLSKA